MYTRIIGILTISALAACGGSGSNPVTGAKLTEAEVAGLDPDDPNTQSRNTAFVFEEDRFLTANQFTFREGDTPAEDTIVVNNLPFDNVSSEEGVYTPRAGVVLPNGQVFDNAEAGGNPYLAVVQVSGTSGALIGAVGTDIFAGFGYGGAFASRDNSGLPADTAIAYRYTGTYNGVRVIRQTGEGALGANNTIQLTTGNATVLVDLQDLDEGGAVVGSVTGRRLYSEDGADLGSLAALRLAEGRIDTSDFSITESTARNINSDGTTAQSGDWSGLFAGPNGEEIVGLLVVEGNLPDTDPNQATNEDDSRTTGREVGGFIVERPED